MQDNIGMNAVEAPSHKTETTLRRNGAAMSLAFFFFMLYFWGWRYGDYLYACQENSMFVPRLDFLVRWMQTPDGFLSWFSAFVLQFSYYPILGGAIYSAILLVLQLQVASLLRLTGSARTLSFLPSCFLLIAPTWAAYYVYLPYNLPINFAMPIALVFTLAVFAGYRRISSPWLRCAASAFYVFCFYPLIGFWAPYFLVLAAAYELTLRNNDIITGSEEPESREHRNGNRSLWARAATIVALAIFVPCAYYYFVYYSRMCRVNIFLLGLFEDVRYDKDSVTAVFAYGFTALAPLSILIAYLAKQSSFPWKGSEHNKRRLRRERKRIEREEAKARRSAASSKKAVEETEDTRIARLERERLSRTVRLSWATFAIFVGATLLASYHNRSFFQVFRSTRALARQDWQTIVELDNQNPFPIEGATQMRNVALYHLGRLGEDVFNRPIAGLGTIDVTQEDYLRSVDKQKLYQLKMWAFNKRRSVEEIANRALIELVYCYWGQTNIGSRIAMSNFTAAEDRSISCLMTLTTAMLVSGEDKLARRYLNELSQTFFYRDWANVRLAYLDSSRFYDGVRDFHNDESISRTIEDNRSHRIPVVSLDEAATKYGVTSKQVEEVASFTEKLRSMRPLRNKSTTRAFPNLVFLVGVVDVDEFEEVDAVRQELILVSLLLQKKGELFLEHAPSYLKNFPEGGAPKGIEQGYALWRYQTYDDKWADCDYKFSQETRSQFALFADYFNQQRNANAVSSPPVQDAIRNYCRGTYWGYAADESVFNRY